MYWSAAFIAHVCDDFNGTTDSNVIVGATDKQRADWLPDLGDFQPKK